MRASPTDPAGDPSAIPFANETVEECDSTSDLARTLGERDCPDGTWVSARRQRAGRGRRGREWRSATGNLFLSYVSRLAPRDRWTWIPLATAVAAADHLRSRYAGLDVRLKWPNDLWIDGRKLGGILCEAVGGGPSPFVVIGLGLNCASAPEGLDQPTISLAQARGAPTDADEVRDGIVQSIGRTLRELAQAGPAEVAACYALWAALPEGCAIEWETGRGIVRGLGPAGELLVATDQGSRALFAEDVRVRLRASGSLE